jgi:hypothetical protein
MAAKYACRLISQLFFCQNNFRTSFHWRFGLRPDSADALPARRLRSLTWQDAPQPRQAGCLSSTAEASGLSHSGLRLRPTWRKCHVVVSEACMHISALSEVKHPVRPECSECVKIGAQWVHLRTCQECGVTLCCDSSPNQHASKHARAARHPVIASAQPAERWLYCYPDEAFAEY